MSESSGSHDELDLHSSLGRETNVEKRSHEFEAEPYDCLSQSDLIDFILYPADTKDQDDVYENNAFRRQATAIAHLLDQDRVRTYTTLHLERFLSSLEKMANATATESSGRSERSAREDNELRLSVKNLSAIVWHNSEFRHHEAYFVFMEKDFAVQLRPGYFSLKVPWETSPQRRRTLGGRNLRKNSTISLPVAEDVAQRGHLPRGSVLEGPSPLNELRTDIERHVFSPGDLGGDSPRRRNASQQFQVGRETKQDQSWAVSSRTGTTFPGGAWGPEDRSEGREEGGVRSKFYSVRQPTWLRGGSTYLNVTVSALSCFPETFLIPLMLVKRRSFALIALYSLCKFLIQVPIDILLLHVAQIVQGNHSHVLDTLHRRLRIFSFYFGFVLPILQITANGHSAYISLSQFKSVEWYVKAAVGNSCEGYCNNTVWSEKIQRCVNPENLVRVIVKCPFDCLGTRERTGRVPLCTSLTQNHTVSELEKCRILFKKWSFEDMPLDIGSKTPAPVICSRMPHSTFCARKEPHAIRTERFCKECDDVVFSCGPNSSFLDHQVEGSSTVPHVFGFIAFTILEFLLLSLALVYKMSDRIRLRIFCVCHGLILTTLTLLYNPIIDLFRRFQDLFSSDTLTSGWSLEHCWQAGWLSIISFGFYIPTKLHFASINPPHTHAGRLACAVALAQYAVMCVMLCFWYSLDAYAYQFTTVDIPTDIHVDVEFPRVWPMFFPQWKFGVVMSVFLSTALILLSLLWAHTSLVTCVAYLR